MTDRSRRCRDHVRGFYAVVDSADSSRLDAILPHTTVVQLRNKTAGAAELRAMALEIMPRVRSVGALFIVNDHLQLAVSVGADGVHLGQDDASLARARAHDDLIVGISTHDPGQVEAAIEGGADYLGYGPVFDTATKVDRFPTQGLVALTDAVTRARPVPVVAIGGITPERAPDVAFAGAAAACAISSVWGAPDPSASALSISSSFDG